jgi:hypothetical protein
VRLVRAASCVTSASGGSCEYLQKVIQREDPGARCKHETVGNGVDRQDGGGGRHFPTQHPVSPSASEKRGAGENMHLAYNLGSERPGSVVADKSTGKEGSTAFVRVRKEGKREPFRLNEDLLQLS